MKSGLSVFKYKTSLSLSCVINSFVALSSEILLCYSKKLTASAFCELENGCHSDPGPHEKKESVYLCIIRKENSAHLSLAFLLRSGRLWASLSIHTQTHTQTHLCMRTFRYASPIYTDTQTPRVMIDLQPVSSSSLPLLKPVRN